MVGGGSEHGQVLVNALSSEDALPQMLSHFPGASSWKLVRLSTRTNDLCMTCAGVRMVAARGRCLVVRQRHEPKVREANAGLEEVDHVGCGFEVQAKVLLLPLPKPLLLLLLRRVNLVRGCGDLLGRPCCCRGTRTAGTQTERRAPLVLMHTRSARFESGGSEDASAP